MLYHSQRTHAWKPPFRGAVEPVHLLELNLPDHELHRRRLVVRVGEEERIRETLIFRSAQGLDVERPGIRITGLGWSGWGHLSERRHNRGCTQR